MNLEFVLQNFKANKLCIVNQTKSEFASLEMNFSRHVLSREGIRPNPKKIKLVREWQSPILAKGVKSFL
jgi:hypothetical protein